MQDITPKHMRCDAVATCPAVYRLENGTIRIIGRNAPAGAWDILSEEGKLDTRNESVIDVQPELLAGVISRDLENAVVMAMDAFRICLKGTALSDGQRMLMKSAMDAFFAIKDGWQLRR